MVEFGAYLSIFALGWYFDATGLAKFAYLLYD